MTDYLRQQAIISHRELKSILKKLKKFAKDGIYAEVDDINLQEFKNAIKNDIPLSEKVLNEYNTPKFPLYHIKIFGPKIVVLKNPRNYLVMQIDADTATPSIPLSKDEAYSSAKNSRGVIAHIYKLVSVIDTR